MRGHTSVSEVVDRERQRADLIPFAYVVSQGLHLGRDNEHWSRVLMDQRDTGQVPGMYHLVDRFEFHRSVLKHGSPCERTLDEAIAYFLKLRNAHYKLKLMR